MRVLLLNQVFHPDPQATSQYLSRLAEELARRGHEVTVLTGRRDYADPTRLYPARETWRGIEIIRVWNAGLGQRSTLRRTLDFLSFLLAAFVRGLFLRRPEVVVALTTPPLVSVLGALFALLYRARFVYWVMDLNPDQVVALGWLKPNAPLVRLLEGALRWSLKRAQRVIVPDVYMRDRLLGKGVPVDKVAVIPLWAQGGVAFDPAGRERFRREHGLENACVVMYSGNHTPCHPLDTLFEAAGLLRDEPRVHFCFVGGGTEWARLRDRAKIEGLEHVTFHGYQPGSELSGLLSAADVQVVVMGGSFVGIVHPCKVYNFLAARRPFISIGPERSHLTDLIRDAGLERVAASFRHGESHALADALRRRAQVGAPGEMDWSQTRTEPWAESLALEKLISALEK